MMYSENGLGKLQDIQQFINKLILLFMGENINFSLKTLPLMVIIVEKNTGGKNRLFLLPSEGLATYNGKAFTANHDGELTYTVNFTDRTGSGKLSNFKDI